MVLRIGLGYEASPVAFGFGEEAIDVGMVSHAAMMRFA